MPRAVRARRLSRRCGATCNAKLLMVTHGGEGVLIVRRQRRDVGRDQARGASGGYLRRGRQLLGGRGRRLRVTGPPAEAARFGNLVASITIMKKGTGTASPGGGAGRGGSHAMTTLAIDIGGTKFSMAAFRRRSDGAPRIARYGSRRRPRLDAGPDRIRSRATGSASSGSSAAASASAAR